MENLNKEQSKKIFTYLKEGRFLSQNMPNKEKFEYIKNYEKEILPALKKPYVLLSMSVEDIYINLITTEDLKNASAFWKKASWV